MPFRRSACARRANFRGRACVLSMECSMKPADFHIGLEFVCGPFWWRCTDVGSRTVTAIRLVEDNPVWYEGPPYMVDEVVLDEAELGDAHLSEEEKIRASIDEARKSGHPGFPH